ncbi:hypothetical protein [Micromonospora sp. NPDC049679]|uniref:LppU/SCO3897 family protein n=1 Tax=Micromonospora sp. NPDC049679 TaxID=3155920 RepID=UPI00340885A8
MSNPGPPGAPYNRRAAARWPGGQPPDAYGPPADPWPAPTSRPDPTGDHNGYPRGGRYEAGSPPIGSAPAGRPDGERPRRRRRVNPWIVLAAVVPVLAIAGAATVIYLLNRSDTAFEADSTGPGAGTARTPTPPAEAGTPQAASSDARFVKTGECLKSDGDATKPKLTIAPCASKTYEVLARFDGATVGEADAKLKCGTVPGYTNWYYFKSELDVLDYVLCLKLR